MRPWRSAPACCSAPRISCGSASSNSTRGWCSKSARTTTKPKPIPAEAIDFLELYARQALLMDQAEPVVQLPGERDFLRYIALGVGAVISPWNFPNAIALGMAGASLVCGNTVILKPSSDSPTIAAKFFEALEEAGMPAGVVNFCPGSGASFGNGLVEHPKMRYIAFTGSRDVGLEIHTRAAQDPEGTSLDQAHRARNGRQGHHRGRCRCQSRFRGGRRDGRRLRLPGPEVLGLLARRGPRGDLRSVPRQTQGQRREAPDRLAGRQRQNGSRDQRGRDEVDPQLHRGRQAGRPPDYRRRARRRRGLSAFSPP